MGGVALGRGDSRGPGKCQGSCGELETERGQKYPGLRRGLWLYAVGEVCAVSEDLMGGVSEGKGLWGLWGSLSAGRMSGLRAAAVTVSGQAIGEGV